MYIRKFAPRKYLDIATTSHYNVISEIIVPFRKVPSCGTGPKVNNTHNYQEEECTT